MEPGALGEVSQRNRQERLGDAARHPRDGLCMRRGRGRLDARRVSNQVRRAAPRDALAAKLAALWGVQAERLRYQVGARVRIRVRVSP